MAEPTDIRVVIVSEGPITGEHPVCGATFTADDDASLTEQVHEAWCWAAGHDHCRCLRRN